MRRLRNLGQLAAVLAVVCVLAPPPAHASWVWKRLRFERTVTSSTTPTFASLYGSAANTGVAFVDSLTFAINVAATGGAGPFDATTGGIDTTMAFSMEDWVPTPIWAHADTASASYFARGGGMFPSDSTLAMYVVVGPSNNNEGATAVVNGADSIYVMLDGSIDGKTWTPVGSGLEGAGCKEIGTSDTWGVGFYTNAKARLATVVPTLIGFPLYRLRIASDTSAANKGRYAAKIGYFASAGGDAP